MNAKDGLKVGMVALDMLGPILALTGLGGDKAADALAAIRGIVESLIKGRDGTATAEDVEADLAALLRTISDNDAAADAIVAARKAKA